MAISMMRIGLLVALIAVLAWQTIASPIQARAPGVRYDNQVLARVTIPSTVGNPDGVRSSLVVEFRHTYGLDVWGVVDLADETRAIDVRLPTPDDLEAVKEAVAAVAPGGTVTIVNSNIQSDIDTEAQENEQALQIAGLVKRQTGVYDPATWFTAYHRFTDILGFFNSLASSYPSLVSVNASIGKSFQGRDLFQVRIGTRTNPSVKQVYIQGLIHAREWVAGSTVQYIAYKLASAYSNPADPDNAWAVRTLNATEFYIVPVVNPDGYEYSWTTDRLWRKNRRRAVTTSSAVGVDLNRNYPKGWGADPNGASTTPSAQDYKGPSPLSEPESRVITSNFVNTLRSAILSIDYHSYSQLILRPPGYNYAIPAAQVTKLKAAGDAGAAAIAARSGRTYTSQTALQLYPATGTAVDYAWDESVNAQVTKDRTNGRVYSYTIELRPSSSDTATGFVLPPSQIVATGEENWAGFKAILDYVRSNII
ncbi:hypothetical protein M427DRAFT_61847 [Gonapodya prolifera JEL478]|uniref:Peptidase M14 domain-containing protein n=1 Tax=Gonapodya prolifera (strain JEL478) TaxID=1344416 RepID=A0A139A2Q7_GONPJ|nr:hypothetical protein M427DRAFT_61847 [Gonapodya prolifera JEL478]|eukprot:KXS10633.1 hypothetical protein M427DRAFT_61847 [Gonapodya prolifera JEL478]